jgi:hypothetical protein
MRRVTRAYAAAFGSFTGEPIEQLPERHQGAYMALFNAGAMGRPFVLEPPRPVAVVRRRAVYDPRRRNIRVLPDPAFGAADALREDRQRAEWLWPLDGSALDGATLHHLRRDDVEGENRSFDATSARARLVLTTVHDPEPDDTAANGARVYLLVRPTPPQVPKIFWSSEQDEPFNPAHSVSLRQELEVRDGQAMPRQVDGFFIYTAPLSHGAGDWPGFGRVVRVRLDPGFSSGRFEIRLFDIARRVAGDADETAH